MRRWTREIWIVVVLGTLSWSAAVGYALTSGHAVHRWFGISFPVLGVAFLVSALVVGRRRPAPWPGRPPSRRQLILSTLIGALAVVQAVIADNAYLRLVQIAVAILMFGNVAWNAVAARSRDRDALGRCCPG